MSCPTYQTDVLEAYLRDQLPAGERTDLESHIAGCADCRRRLDELRRLVGGLREIGRREMKREIAEQAARQRVMQRRSSYPWMQAAAVFLVVSFITSYWYVFHLSSNSETIATRQEAPLAVDETVHAAEESADSDDLTEKLLSGREPESASPSAEGRRTSAAGAGKAAGENEITGREGEIGDRPQRPAPAEPDAGQARGDMRLAGGEEQPESEQQDNLSAGSAGVRLGKSSALAADLPDVTEEKDEGARPLLYKERQRDSTMAQSVADYRYYQNTAESFAVAERHNQIQLYQGKNQLNITMKPGATTVSEARKKQDVKNRTAKEHGAAEWPDSFDVQIEQSSADQIEMIWLGTAPFEQVPLNAITVIWLNDSLYRVTVHDSLSYQIKPAHRQFRAFRER